MFTIQGGHSDITDRTETRRHLFAEEESPSTAEEGTRISTVSGIEGHMQLCAAWLPGISRVVLKLISAYYQTQHKWKETAAMKVLVWTELHNGSMTSTLY